jgi:hypothetical protein
MNYFVTCTSIFILAILTACNTTEAEEKEENWQLVDPIADSISQMNSAETEMDYVEATVIPNQLSAKIPSLFKQVSANNQRPEIGVEKSIIYEYVEPGNKEITFFFIHTVYQDSGKTIQNQYDAIVNSPRINSSRLALTTVEINGIEWLYEQYEMNEPDGTPVMYDDFIYINDKNMVGATLCCNSDVYGKWAATIQVARESLKPLNALLTQ